MLAEWSEEYFNNRALFSDYYLKERLTDPTSRPRMERRCAPSRARDLQAHHHRP